MEFGKSLTLQGQGTFGDVLIATEKQQGALQGGENEGIGQAGERMQYLPPDNLMGMWDGIVSSTIQTSEQRV